MKSLKATVLNKDGRYHYLVKDEEGNLHWIIRGNFDQGAPTEDGSEVIIELRYKDLSWHVKGNADESSQ